MAWRPTKITEKAHQLLKLCSAVTGRDMRDLASEAIIKVCSEELPKAARQLVMPQKRKRK